MFIIDIGIYKPGKPIYFDTRMGDTAGWSAEVTGLIKVLEHLGHDVEILSDTDDDSRKQTTTQYDRIFVYNGKFKKEDYDALNALHGSKILCVSDLSLQPTIGEVKFDKTLWQGPNTTEFTYFPLHALVCLLQNRQRKAEPGGGCF